MAFRITGLGRVAANAEVKVFGERKVINVTVISNRRTKKGNDWVEEATSLPVQHWVHVNSKLEDFLQKGQQVMVVGVLATESWKKDGIKHYKNVLIADEIELGAKPSGNSATPAEKPTGEKPAATKAEKQPAPQVDIDDDEIPF